LTGISNLDLAEKYGLHTDGIWSTDYCIQLRVLLSPPFFRTYIGNEMFTFLFKDLYF